MEDLCIFYFAWEFLCVITVYLGSPRRELSRECFTLHAALALEGLSVSVCFLSQIFIYESYSSQQICKETEQDDIQRNSRENGTVHSNSDFRSNGTANGTQQSDNNASAESTVNYLDLLKTGRMALYTTVMSFAWFFGSLVYYGLSYNTSNFQTSVHALFVLTGCVEIPAYALGMLFIIWRGRQWSICIFLLLSGVLCGSVIFFLDDDDLFILKIMILLMWNFGVTGIFGTIYVLAPDLYPIQFRNMGLVAFTFFASILGILAPLTVYATKEISIDVNNFFFEILILTITDTYVMMIWALISPFKKSEENALE